MNRFYGKIMLAVFAVFLLAYGVMAGFSSEAAVAEQAAASSKNSLSVSGQGKVSVKPDMALITVGVTNEDKLARNAQAENNKQMEKVMSALKAVGIKEDDIRTVNVDLYPKYQYITRKEGGDRQELVGYVATNQVQVTVREVSNVGRALDAVVGAGANLAGGISFTLSEARMEKAYADALTAALKNGKSKADVLAKGLGITLGKPKEVAEGGGYTPPILFGRGGYDAAMKAEAVPVAPGQMDVSASVSLRYEY